MLLERPVRRAPIAEMNVVPYVDVMLVLLVIFMAATPMLMQGVTVNLPVAQAAPLKQQENLPVLATVNKHGEFFLNMSAQPEVSLSASTLQAEIAAALSLAPGRPVLVRADKDVAYDKVLQVMVLLQQAGVPHVGLETTAFDLAKG